MSLTYRPKLSRAWVNKQKITSMFVFGLIYARSDGTRSLPFPLREMHALAAGLHEIIRLSRTRRMYYGFPA
jgi:hypothetical protein